MRPSSGLQPATRRWRAFVMPSFRPPLHPRSTLPPPRRVGLRFPTPVGHGRGLASRPGCAGPGEGVGSPCLRPASPTPGERGRRRRAPAASPAASRCSPALATLSVCLRSCRTESGGTAAPQNISANTLAHPTIDVMQSSRARRIYSPLPLRLRLHNAGYYPTCQQVAAAHDKFTLRDRLCRLRSGASLFGMSGRVFKRSALFLATRRQTGPPPKCGGFGRRCGPHRSWPGAPKSGCW